MIAGHATTEGTRAYAAGFLAESAQGFFRRAQGLTISSLGIGSYLGEMDAAADTGYEEAVAHALQSGINFIDTSLNYRHQRSERNIGAAIARAGVARAGYVVCTKAGYLVPGAVPEGLAAGDIVAGMHSLSPDFLEDQLERSRANLALACIDVFYLHNPETQLEPIGESAFYQRVHLAFARLESLCDSGKIRYYGAATWNGFRAKGRLGLDLSRLCAIATSLRGDQHRFRFIQLPLNIAMPEALSIRDAEGRNVLERAQALGVTVVASASLMQSRLARGLPPVIGERMKGPENDAQRAIQFTRSTPGVTVALVGMGRKIHVVSNLGVADFPPATREEYMGLFR